MRPPPRAALVAAIARNGVIGREGRLPWRIPEDLRRFKATTMGHVLVMGRRTYDSIGRPLPGRTTVVVTRQGSWQPPGGRPPGLLVAGSLEGALASAAELDDTVFVVGGAEIYAQALPLASELLLTWVDAEPGGDVWFPEVSWDDWTQVESEEHEGWRFARYRRTAAIARP